MAWLLREGEVLASLDMPGSRRGLLRGMIGRPWSDGAALLLRPARAVHTVGLGRPIDVAFCDEELVVLDVLPGLRPLRMTRPRRGCRAVIEAEAGAFERWRLQVGDRLEVKGGAEG